MLYAQKEKPPHNVSEASPIVWNDCLSLTRRFYVIDRDAISLCQRHCYKGGVQHSHCMLTLTPGIDYRHSFPSGCIPTIQFYDRLSIYVNTLMTLNGLLSVLGIARCRYKLGAGNYEWLVYKNSSANESSALD